MLNYFRKSKIFKFILDILLFITTILLTNIDFTGGKVHEVLGILIFVLLIFHVIFNFNWIKSVTKNFKKVNIKTKIMYIINIGILVIYLCAIIFGIAISNELFNFKNSNNIYIVILHFLFGRLAIVMMSVHLGMHLDRILIKLKFCIISIYIIIVILVFIYSIYKLTHSYQWMFMFGF